MNAPRVAVIGGGWAGIAAAVRLLEGGCVPTLIEAARQPGGRARRVDWQIDGGPIVSIDNGQHILIGAYRDTLALMRTVGVDPDSVLWRHPVALRSATGFHFEAAPLPAPWHVVAALVTARGLGLAGRVALVRLLAGARRRGWRLERDLSLGQWLMDQRQPPKLIADLWAPLCVAALNTPVAIASAQVFLNVLRDSLGAEARASDLLLPRASLDALLPGAALGYLARAGASVELGERVTDLALGDTRVLVTCAGRPAREFDGAVLAVAAHQVSALLRDRSCHVLSGLAAQCEALTWQPITTAYLRYATVPELPLPMIALSEDAAHGDYGQWLFDKGKLGAQQGLVAVVISASGPHQDLDQPTLLASVAAQLARQLGFSAAPLAARAFSEKRATFACLPGLARPANRTPAERLVVAGDYTESDYPATLESAVQSGQSAAVLLSTRLRSA